jgi:hypothetical protein
MEARLNSIMMHGMGTLHFFMYGVCPRAVIKNMSLAQEGLLINRMGTSLRQHMVKHRLLEYIHRSSCLS